MEKMIEGKDFSQKDIDEVKSGKKHVLVAVGYLGGMHCYLNLGFDEIVKRFEQEFHGPEEQADLNEYSVTIIGFDDSFEAYEVREKN